MAPHALAAQDPMQQDERLPRPLTQHPAIITPRQPCFITGKRASASSPVRRNAGAQAGEVRVVVAAELECEIGPRQLPLVIYEDRLDGRTPGPRAARKRPSRCARRSRSRSRRF